MTGSTLKLIGLVIPLGLDTLGVALALGVAGLTPKRRLSLSLVFAGFEAGMPLIGVAVGAPLGQAIGRSADYAAAGLIVTLGVYILFFERKGENESARVISMAHRGLAGMVALGVSISLDELAIGISAGLLRVPIVVLVLAVGLQAFIFTQIGVRLGSRVGARVPEAAEKIAGVALVALGAILLAEQLGA